MQALGLPRHPYTIRDVKSGALFVDYADELSTTYAIMATDKILAHLGRGGVDLNRSVLLQRHLQAPFRCQRTIEMSPFSPQ